MSYDWLFRNPHGDTGPRRRSKNNLSGIRMGIGPVWGLLSYPFILSCAASFYKEFQTFSVEVCYVKDDN